MRRSSQRIPKTVAGKNPASLPPALHAQVFADAVARAYPVTLYLDELFADETAWAVAGWKPASRAASAGAVDAALDFARWDAGGVPQRADA